MAVVGDRLRADRLALIDELWQIYGDGGGGAGQHWRRRRKRWAWLIVTRGATALKAALDVVVATIAMIALLPLFLGVALAIKLTDSGPVFFWQRRVGRFGREFPFPKFRSMCMNAEEVKAKLAAQNQHGGEGVTFKMKRDPRVTWIGRIIRKLSIDEAPQLWCVLTGEMSLVGPRPPLPSEVARYTLADRRRLEVTPGLTCIWQVSGRSDIPFDRQVKLDVEYIRSQSFWMDVKLLFKTIPAVLLGRGAY
ncbi:MAG: sugar transferase [Bryobacterales bacterium]|nr:sugar transferase [Bryobacterales bacterium]